MKIGDQIPSEGWKGILRHWRDDLVAAISVSLVALPLSLAIAVAAGVPPISGLITAVIGGIITTVFRSSALAINGPAAGLIGVVLAGIVALDDGCGSLKSFEYVLAAIMIAGFLQVIIGIFKLGKIAELFPSTVIHGILASIGIIIFANQMHVAMGTNSNADNTIGILIDVIYKIPDINPFIAIISTLGIVLLIFHARISYKVFHFIPAPVWVLVISVPIVIFYNYLENNQIAVLGTAFKAPENYLIDIPNDWRKGFLFPDFSKFWTITFWMVVISINLLSTVITLAGTKAVDKLDPYKRKTNLNRDLIGVGISSIVSGAVGGLPVITVIVRSTVNVHNEAKTKWSNFFHGLFILLFILFLLPLIQMFPKAALAAVLVITGVKLASPRLFREIYNQGLEQIIFFISTIVITLYKDPLVGLIGGMGITLVTHLLISRVSIPQFFHMIFNSGTNLVEQKDNMYILNIKGVANFLSMLRLIGFLDKVSEGSKLKVDLSKASLIDLTFQEKLLEFKRTHLLTGGEIDIIGLQKHISTSNHDLAIKSLLISRPDKISPRQQRMSKIAEDNNWVYIQEEKIDSLERKEFEFFKSRPLDKKLNVISSQFSNIGVDWEISDIVFDEGAMLSKEKYRTTIQLLHLPKEIPTFVIDKDGFFGKLFDRVMSLKSFNETNLDPIFYNKNIKLIAEDEESIRRFFTPSLISFLESEEIYHIESNGIALIIFKHLRYSNTGEIKNMVRFSEEFAKNIISEEPIKIDLL